MRSRIAIVAAVLVAFGSTAEATILNIVSCESGDPIPGVQKQADAGGQPSETIRYEVSAPGFTPRTVTVEVDSVSEACLEPAPTPSEDFWETNPGSEGNEGDARGGENQRDDNAGSGPRSNERELLPVPGPSADERARQHLETNERRPATWVDTGPEQNVDGQIGAIGRLLDAKKPPPQTRPRVATPAPSAPGPTESDTTPEIVPDDTGLHSLEEIADPDCASSDATAGANEKNDRWGANLCKEFENLKAHEKLRQEAREKGKDPDEAHPYTPVQRKRKMIIEDAANSATKAGEASCAKKITCEKVACKTQCNVSFLKMIETTSCKLKRTQISGRWIMRDRLRVKVLGNCGCTCAPKSACAGVEAAM